MPNAMASGIATADETKPAIISDFTAADFEIAA
jgi:hypothetical protein